MKRNLFRILCFLIVACIAGSVAGCKKKPGSSGEPIKLVMWDDKANEDEAKVIKGIVEDWNKANPNAIIERQATDIDSYKMKISTALSANEGPDLFYAYAGGFSKPLVDSGKVLQLDEFVSKDTLEKALPGVLQYCTYDEKLYALPITLWCGFLFCNQEMFDKYNIKIPTTYSEMVDVVKQFRAKKIGALGVGVKETWTPALYYDIMALRTVGLTGCVEALSGKSSFNSAGFIDAAAKIDELNKLKGFNDGAMSMNWDEQASMFKLGKFPMIYTGSWLAQMVEQDETSKVKGKIVAAKFPIVEGGKGAATEYLGGATDVFMVNASTKYKEEAVRALEFIATQYSKRGYEAGSALPVFKDTFDTSKLDRVTLQMIELMKDATGYLFAWDTFLEPEDADLSLNLVQELFAGVKNPQDFAKALQKINEN